MINTSSKLHYFHLKKNTMRTVYCEKINQTVKKGEIINYNLVKNKIKIY